MTVAELYQRMERALGLDFSAVEALNDGLLVVTHDGQEFWVTAKEEK